MYEFDYQRPTAVNDAVKIAGGDARYLAGGQSLVQAMKLRMASASTLVDLGGMPDLRFIKVDGNTVTIGAMTTHATVARSSEVIAAIPALAELAGSIGDPMVRNLGTIGGSVANADPAACYPSAVLALDATIQTNQRTLPAEGFFKGLFETALEAGEMIVSISFPIVRAASYQKLRQPASRFALVGVFVANGAAGPRVAVTGAASHAFRVTEMEAALAKSFTPDAIAGIKVPAAGLNGDIHGSAEYRAAMITVLAQRGVAAALAR
ncbi:MAG TPA: xanthine dehydrogenase family protein subunit M [Lautropia sp.]|jgi:carbon-monoxide dehydrogenase medium subunit|nr:xanthine dehydrogenase family protein subunit M [Lautropia sp.]